MALALSQLTATFVSVAHVPLMWVVAWLPQREICAAGLFCPKICTVLWRKVAASCAVANVEQPLGLVLFAAHWEALTHTSNEPHAGGEEEDDEEEDEAEGAAADSEEGMEEETDADDAEEETDDETALDAVLLVDDEEIATDPAGDDPDGAETVAGVEVTGPNENEKGNEKKSDDVKSDGETEKSGKVPVSDEPCVSDGEGGRVATGRVYWFCLWAIACFCSSIF